MAMFLFLVYWASDGLLRPPRLAAADVATWLLDLVSGQPLGHALIHAGIGWVTYMALEPFVRRLWPTVMVSWARLLDGRIRDPRIGSDILIGGLLGALLSSLTPVTALVQEAFGLPLARPLGSQGYDVLALDGVRWVVSGLLTTAGGAVFFAVSLVLLPLFLRAVVRKTWIAALGAIVLYGLLPLASSEYPLEQWFGVAAAVINTALLLIVLLRFGFVATLVALFVRSLSEQMPLSLSFGEWTARNGLLVFAVLVGLMAYGCRVALAGRPVFGSLAREG
jgi:serine/threonine-protein kinase